MKLQSLQDVAPAAFEHFIADLSQYEFKITSNQLVCKFNDTNAGPLVSEWTGNNWTDWKVDEEELKKFRGTMASAQFCEWDTEVSGL